MHLQSIQALPWYKASLGGAFLATASSASQKHRYRASKVSFGAPKFKFVKKVVTKGISYMLATPALFINTLLSEVLQAILA